MNNNANGYVLSVGHYYFDYAIPKSKGISGESQGCKEKALANSKMIELEADFSIRLIDLGDLLAAKDFNAIRRLGGSA